MRIKVTNFGGMIPKIEPKMLPLNAAVDAINCDLTGYSIKSMLQLLDVGTTSAATSQRDAVKGLVQFPTPCLQSRSQTTVANFAYVTPAAPKAGINWVGAYPFIVGHNINTAGSSYTCLVDHTSGVFATDLAAGKWVLNGTTITVGANDDLWCAVALPASPAPIAGQGCIDILFTDGTSLSASLADQNGVVAKSGNLASYATGTWYRRVIQLGGQLASDASAITGKTIASAALYHNHTGGTLYKAHYGFIAVVNRSTEEHKQIIYDSDRDRGSNWPGGSVIDDVVIDYDNAAMYYGLTASDRAYVANCALPGSPRLKVLTSETDGAGGVRGLSAHDIIYWRAATPAWAGYANLVKGPATVPAGAKATGWAGVTRPTEALGAPSIVGGVATDVTRAYVYTNVSADGLESGPSPAKSATGKPDGSWNFTAIPTWTGGDNFGVSTSGRALHTRRLYRTPVGSALYRLVGTLDDNDTAFNDAVTDANLGAELGTTNYADMPAMYSLAQWYGGVIGGITDNGEVAFSARYAPHAWPFTQRYTPPSFPLACESLGDRFVALTVKNPVLYYGSDLENLIPLEIENGDSCVTPSGVVKSSIGIFYPGAVGWGLLNASGYQNITGQYIEPEQFSTYVGAKNAAMFDGRRLLWIIAGQSTGYALELGAGERGLVKFQVEYAIYDMSFYQRRQSRWVLFDNAANIKFGKLFAGATKYKWTWKSKPHVTAAPESMAVAKMESSEWASLPYAMRNRVNYWSPSNLAWVTSTAYVVGDIRIQGGIPYTCLVNHTSGTFTTDCVNGRWLPAPYSATVRSAAPEWATSVAYTAGTIVYVTGNGAHYVCLVNHTSTAFAVDLGLFYWSLLNPGLSITGLAPTQSFAYLKIWADADDATNKRLVFDDFVGTQDPVALVDSVKSDCWQFEIRGNIEVTSVTIATSEGELNLQEE